VVLLTTLYVCSSILAGAETGRHPEIAGCWEGGLVRGGKIVDAQLRLFTQRSDGTLALSYIYETGPRSRIWKYDTDVICSDNEISWLAHHGFLDATGDTMNIDKEWKGEKSRWLFVRNRQLDGFIAGLRSSESAAYEYMVPEIRNDGWECDDLKNAGLDSATMIQLMQEISAGKHGDIHSIVLVKGSKLVLEEYFALNGNMCGPVVTEAFRDKVHHMASVTKAVTSALIGIAIDNGLIDRVDVPLFALLPQYDHLSTDDKSRIRLKHMLTMTPGLQWEQSRYSFSDRRNDGGQLYRCRDAVEYVLSKPLVAEPGDRFEYSNGFATVVGVVLEHASGMNVDKFAEQSLFVPLGISEYQWTRYPDGSFETDGGLALRSRDLAKIGQLFMDVGIWRERRVISESWVRESTLGRVNLGRSRKFGYYWNEMKVKVNQTEYLGFFAPGHGGQFVAVLPDLDLVFVATAGNYGKDPTKTYWNLLKKYVLPALDTGRSDR
jgi:CubicO group peptidase (beta-lactamase class C family)